MSESDTERLKQHLEGAIDEWRDAVESGDEKGAAYALGKKSAFITAIEDCNGWEGPAGTDQ